MRSDGRQGVLRHAQAYKATTAMRMVRLALSTTVAIVGLMLLAALAGAALPAPTPVNTSAPALTGTPIPGQTLTCSTGTWANNPSGYTYAWLRDGSPIPGQSASAYAVQNADSGHSISCQVTAVNVGGEYTIVALSSGSYKISFGTGSEVALNYLPQYYSNQSSLSAATAVAVTAPNAVGNINAALQAGGQIGGKVTAAVGGAALAKIEVCATVGETLGKCATTNAAGEYTIVGLRSGTYTVASIKELFGSEGNYASQSQAGVAVTAPNTTGGVNLQLPPGGQISGRVTNTTSSAVEGVMVCAIGESFGCAFSNSSGEYVVSGLATGYYRIAFIPGVESAFGGSSNSDYLTQFYNGKSQFSEAEEVLIIAPGVAKIDAELQSGGEISGVVKDAATHALLAGAEVCASSEAGGNCASTNAAGEYTIVGLATSPSYTVEFSAPEGANYQTFSLPGVSVAAPKKTENVNAELQAGGQISGMATDASTHARLANVGVCATSGESTHCASTNATGEYSIGALSSGSYQVGFFAPTGQNYVSQTLTGVSVTAPSTTTSVNAAMQPGAEIGGRVTDAVSGAGIGGIEVCAFPAGGGFAGCATTNGVGGSASATSAALAVPRPDGRFHLLKKPKLDAKGNLVFVFHVANPGTFKWRLSFRGSSCKGGHHGHKCHRSSVRFGSGSQSVAGAGTVELKVHASAKALKALKAGLVLRVSGKFTFQSAFGGAPVSHGESAVVRMHRKKGKHHKK